MLFLYEGSRFCPHFCIFGFQAELERGRILDLVQGLRVEQSKANAVSSTVEKNMLKLDHDAKEQTLQAEKDV